VASERVVQFEWSADHWKAGVISKQGENLVFLLGVARSGTTLLSVMLNNHPDVRCPPEPWLMLGLEAAGRTSARHPADAPVLYRAMREFCDAQAAVAGARAFAGTVYNRRLSESKKKILVDKTPRYYLILPYLREVFPEAKYIALWRNPLDSAASMKKAWGFDIPKLLSEHQDHLACMDVVLGPRRILEFVKENPERVLALQYEKLVREPKNSMDGIFQWLGLPGAEVGQFDLNGGEFDKSEYGDKKILATGGPHEKSIGQWREVFNADETRVLLDMIGPNIFAALGYEDVLGQAGEMGVRVEGSGNSAECAQRLERNVAARLAEYDKVPTYSDLLVREGKLAKALKTAGPAGDLWTEMQDYLVAAEGMALEVARVEQIAEQWKLVQAGYDARLNEARHTHQQLAAEMAAREGRLSAEVASARAEAEAARQSAAQREQDSRQFLEQREQDWKELAAQREQEAQRIVAQREAELQKLVAERERDLQQALNREKQAEQCAAEVETIVKGRDAELESQRKAISQLEAELRESWQRERVIADRFTAISEQFSATVAQAESNRQDLERRLALAMDELQTHKQARAELADQLRKEQETAVELKSQFDEASRGIDQALVEYDEEEAQRAREESASMRGKMRRLAQKIGVSTIAAPATGNGKAAADMTDTATIQTTRLGAALRQLAHAVKMVAAPKPEMMDAAIAHLAAKKFNPKVVFDLGAAKGYWTERFAWHWPEAEVFMIDPLEESEPYLKTLCAKDSRFHYLRTAVGKESGTLTMNITKDFDGSSLLPFPAPDPKRQRQIQVQRIDDLLAEGKLKAPDLVKLDVQGFELNVMDGGQRMFETAEVFIIEVSVFRFMENCPRVDEVVRYMADRKFIFFDIAGMLRRPFENDMGQMDIVFVSEKSPLVGSNRWF